MIFGDPLYFQHGKYAKPALWVSTSDKAVGHWGVSLKTYLYAMVDDMGLATLILAAAGLAFYGWRTRRTTESLGPAALLAFFPFFVYALYAGQRPLHVPPIDVDMYNLRYGLIMILPASICTGFLVITVRRWHLAWLRRAVHMTSTLVVLVAAVAAGSEGIATLDEARGLRAAAKEQGNAAAAAWLRTHYDYGDFLMESFGNETVSFASHIPQRAMIYEGSFRRWEPALADPAAHGIRWIYLCRDPAEDEVWKHLRDKLWLSAEYTVAYHDRDRFVYRHVDGPNRSGS